MYRSGDFTRVADAAPELKLGESRAMGDHVMFPTPRIISLLALSASVNEVDPNVRCKGVKPQGEVRGVHRSFKTAKPIGPEPQEPRPHCSANAMTRWQLNTLPHRVQPISGPAQRWKLHKKMTPLPPEAPYPGVSILKPLMGVDPNLFTNLESFFTMNYPLFELLLCVEDESDPAIMLARSLMKKYPNVDSRLFTGGASVGVNPKINNMYPAYMAAKYDMLLISDSGIRMKEDTLLDMVLHMTEFIGLVHQMPFTCDRKGFAATLEKIYFGTAQARIYLSADFLGIICHTGMSTLMRKSLIDDVGGLAKFGCYLAEDFFFAKSLTNRGWKMRISSQPAWQNSGLCEISCFQARLTRWAKLRVAMVPFTIILEPLSECMVLGAFASWAVSFLFNWDPLSFYLVHILLWFLCDWILISIVQNFFMINHL
uniref:ceramide glucosyltransferase n=1 Tax=Timema shepardi TaxID=629360 RepID=A0A7R9AJX8_TIMSH|nr:unnamed protein product [Timema shepardi]